MTDVNVLMIDIASFPRAQDVCRAITEGVWTHVYFLVTPVRGEYRDMTLSMKMSFVANRMPSVRVIKVPPKTDTYALAAGFLLAVHPACTGAHLWFMTNVVQGVLRPLTKAPDIHVRVIRCTGGGQGGGWSEVDSSDPTGEESEGSDRESDCDSPLWPLTGESESGSSEAESSDSGCAHERQGDPSSQAMMAALTQFIGTPQCANLMSSVMSSQQANGSQK